MYTSHVCTMYDVLCTFYRTCPSYAIIITQTTNLRKLFSYIKKTIRKNSVSRSCGSWKTDRNVFKNQPPHLLRYLFSDNTVQCARVLSQSQDDHYRYSRPGDSLSVGCTFTMGNIQDHMTFQRSYDIQKIIWLSKDHMTFQRTSSLNFVKQLFRIFFFFFLTFV